MQKDTIVSFADGAGNYAKGLMRLELSLKKVGFDGNFRGYNDYAHIGSPFHKGSTDAIPYAFKAHSIKKVMDEGARYIMWMDSPVYATQNIQPVWDHIYANGYLFFDNVGYSIGDYTSDACLDKFGMTRDEAFRSKMIMACVMGFDTHHPDARYFLDQYIAAASDGISYVGDWTNENLQVSNDMRVKGHRHDQSVASILCSKIGMKITNAQNTYFAYDSHKGLVPLADTICLWSNGY